MDYYFINYDTKTIACEFLDFKCDLLTTSLDLDDENIDFFYDGYNNEFVIKSIMEKRLEPIFPFENLDNRRIKRIINRIIKMLSENGKYLINII